MESQKQPIERNETEFECLTKLLLTTSPSAAAQVGEGNEDSKPFVYVYSKWSKEKLEVILHNSCSGKCYKGHTTVTELNSIAEELEITPVVFLKECREALSAMIAMPMFECLLELTPEGNTFQLFKHCEYPINYLEIRLAEVKGSGPLIDAAIRLLHVKQEKSSGNNNYVSNEAMNSRYGVEALNVLNKLQEERDSFERRLLKKVTLLLQTKKNRIAELEGQLAEIQRNGSDDSDHSQPMDDDAATDCSEDFEALTQAL